MYGFIEYIETINSLKLSKQYDEARKIANQGIADLLDQNNDTWFMMYYQMADILAREKKWKAALFHMWLVIHYLHWLGGVWHEKFVKRLLKKFNKERLFKQYIEVCKNTDPKKLEGKIIELIEP